MKKIIQTVAFILSLFCIFAVTATAVTVTSPAKNPALDPANQGNAPVGGGQNLKSLFVLNEKEEPYFACEKFTDNGEIVVPVSTQKVLDIIKSRTDVEVENLGEGLFRYEEDGQRVYLTPESVVDMYDESISLPFQSEKPIRQTTIRKATNNSIETLQAQINAHTEIIQRLKICALFLIIVLCVTSISILVYISRLKKAFKILYPNYETFSSEKEQEENRNEN